MPTKKANLLRWMRLNPRVQISTNAIKGYYGDYGRIMIRRMTKKYPIEVVKIGRMNYYRYIEPKDYTRLYIITFALLLLLGLVGAIISR